MKRLIFPIFLLVALALSWTVLPVTAQQAPQILNFSLTYAGQSSPVYTLTNTSSTCGVTITGGGTFSLTPQSSNDGQNWVTASSVNSGAISAAGTYTGGIANTGIVAFRLLVASIDSTPVTGSLVCSASLARVSGGGGGTPIPCPTASTNITITGTDLPNCSFSASGGAQATPAAGNCIAVSTPPAAGTIAYSCATPTTAPSPQVTATACAAQPSVGAGGVISVPAGCSGGGGVNTVPSPTANPSPYPGYLQVTSGIYVGAAPTPAPGATAIPQAFLLQSTSCAPQSNIASWGTSASSLFGITGTVAALGCRAASPVFLVDTSGNVVGSTLIGSNLYSIQTAKSDCPSSPLAAGTLFGCAGGNNQGAVVLGGTTSHCTIDWNKSTSSYLTLGCALNLSNSAANNGEVTCALSSSTSCMATATVRSGAKCIASYEEADTTVTPLTDLLPLQVHTATTTLTVYMDVSVALTGTLAANYWCP